MLMLIAFANCIYCADLPASPVQHSESLSIPRTSLHSVSPPYLILSSLPVPRLSYQSATFGKALGKAPL